MGSNRLARRASELVSDIADRYQTFLPRQGAEQPEDFRRFTRL